MEMTAAKRVTHIGIGDAIIMEIEAGQDVWEIVRTPKGLHARRMEELISGCRAGRAISSAKDFVKELAEANGHEGHFRFRFATDPNAPRPDLAQSCSSIERFLAAPSDFVDTGTVWVTTRR